MVNPLDLFDRTTTEYLSIITLGVWNTCIAFILWLWGLSKIPDVARGNYLFFLDADDWVDPKTTRNRSANASK